MLEIVFNEVYNKFKLNFYRGVFERLKEREASLSASEAYAVEVIHMLQNPTVSRFAEFLRISLPNATYKINTLEKKGYVKRIKSDTDKREYYLATTPKFQKYYAINQNYTVEVMKRVRERFSGEEITQFENMLKIISRELMPENGEKL